jgi:methylmalonyl-CoA mutase, C-terminal domain
MDVSSLPHKPRVLVAKIGLDGHNRGAYVVAYGLREFGCEVIYTGLRQTPATVAQAAVQEDVDVIGISSMVGNHLSVVRKLRAELEKLKAPDIPIVIGGIIPQEDYAPLAELGVKKVFGTGASVKDIAEFVNSVVTPPVWEAEIPGTIGGTYPDDLHMLGTYCDQCKQTFFPPRRNCPCCMDDKAVKLVELSRTGILQSCIVSAMAPPGYPPPHGQGYVKLDNNGPTIFVLLADFNQETLQSGCRVELKIVELRKNQNNEPVVTFRFRPI